LGLAAATLPDGFRLFICQRSNQSLAFPAGLFFRSVVRIHDMQDRIEINRRIHHGQPVIKGTRVPVTRILAEVASGASFERIQRQYDVTAADIRAAVAFANDLVEHQAFIPTSAVTDEE
jgi:uncharacterized protein (DUF433 family)